MSSQPGKYNGDSTIARLGSSAALPIGNVTFTPAIPRDVILRSGHYERIKLGDYETPAVNSFGSLLANNFSLFNPEQEIVYDVEGATEITATNEFQDALVLLKLPNLKYVTGSLNVNRYDEASTYGGLEAPQVKFVSYLEYQGDYFYLQIPQLEYTESVFIDIVSSYNGDQSINLPAIKYCDLEFTIRCGYSPLQPDGIIGVNVPSLEFASRIQILSYNTDGYLGQFGSMLSQINFPSLKYTKAFDLHGQNNISASFIGTAINLPSLLNNYSGSMTLFDAMNGNDSLTSINLTSGNEYPYLTSITAGQCNRLILSVQNAPVLSTIPSIEVGRYELTSCPSITNSDLTLTSQHVGFSFTNMTGITSLILPNTLHTDLYIQDCANITEVDLPTVELIGGINFGQSCTSLTTFNIGSSLKRVGFYPNKYLENNYFDSLIQITCPLDQASVDNVLVRLAALDGTNGTTIFDNQIVNLSGACSTPSQTGLDAVAVLQGRNCLVNHN